MGKQRNIFRKESLEQYSTTELFNDYIKQAKLRWYLVTIALLAILICLFFWSLLWKVPDTVTCHGYVNADGTISCYIPTGDVPEKDKLFSATVFSIDGTRRKGNVESFEPYPLSEAEISRLFDSDYLRANLVTGAYSYSVILSPEDKRALPPSGTLCEVSITVGEQSPIDMLVE